MDVWRKDLGGGRMKVHWVGEYEVVLDRVDGRQWSSYEVCICDLDFGAVW